MTTDTDTIERTDSATEDKSQSADTTDTSTQTADTTSTTDDADRSKDAADQSTDVSDWVESASRGDTKRAERLKRFTDPGALFDSYAELERQLSDQKRVRIPDADAKPEDLETWKRMAGIPETAEGYKIKVDLPEGESFDDNDTELLTNYTKKLHEQGGLMAHPQVVQGLHQIYADMRADAAAQLIANATAKHEETQAILEKEWGPEKDRNVGFANAFLGRYGGDDAKDLLKMPMQDGTLVGDHPAIVRMLAKAGREVGDDPLFVEASSHGDAVETLEARRDKIMALRTAGKFKEYDAKASELMDINSALQRHAKKSR